MRALIAFALAAAACRPAADDTLVLAAFTSPREAYGRAVVPAFQEEWRARTGRAARVLQSYQASGSQARAVLAGLDADVVALAMAPDVQQLAAQGLVRPDWNRGPVAPVTTVVALAVRPGNPLGIRGFGDLARPGVRVLLPNPRTSGGAMWNLAAIYGEALRSGGSPAVAQERVMRVLANVATMDKGARESMYSFEHGVGDVAVTYESEVFAARAAGRPVELVVPPSTLLIDPPVTVVDAVAQRRGTRALAEAFIEFLFTPRAQRAFAAWGLRPTHPEVAAAEAARFARVADLWTIEYLGGWERVRNELFGPEGTITLAMSAVGR